MSVWRSRLCPFEGLHDRGGGQPLVDEQGQRRHVEREPFGLAGPVEKGLRQRLQLADFGARSGQLLACGVEVVVGYAVGVCLADVGGEPRDALAQRGDLRLRPLARRVPSVPVERRRQRRVVAPGGGLLFLAELRLRADLGPEQRARLGVPVALGPSSLVLPGPSVRPVGCRLRALPARERRARWMTLRGR